MAAADAVMAAKLGVGSSVIQAFRRDLVLGVHWLQDAGGKVSYTPLGEARLAAMVKPAPEKKEGPSHSQPIPTQLESRAFTIWLPEEKKEGVVCQLLIVRCHANPRAVRARTPAGDLVDVFVKSNRTLRKRIQLRCRQLADGRWECCHPGYAVKLPPL